MQPLISVKDLEKTFYDSEIPTQALRGVTFDIQKGEFVAIMGASGSGKSTLLHMIGFLDQYTKGEYFFDGENIANFDDDEIAHIRNKKIGFVFQSFNLLSGTSVLENVKLPLVYSDVPEKQRVSIARALVNDPDVIFADEPTGNLDSKSGGQVMDIIKRLSHKGKTVVLITHETHTAEYAQRIIRILDGKIFSDEKVAHVREEGEFIK